MGTLFRSFIQLLIFFSALGNNWGQNVWAQNSGEVSKQAHQAEVAPKAGHGWTLDQAEAHLRLYPRDVYMQYVKKQLMNRAGLRSEQTSGWSLFGGRPRQVDLFDLFSGALAVQESLQLETMNGRRNTKKPANSANKLVAISELVGPTIKSHPWTEMLAGNRPEMSPLAKIVPEDQYFVLVQSTSKLLDLLESGDLWGVHLASQSKKKATTQLTGDRMRLQLAIKTNKTLQPFYDRVVEELAITGSDLYLNEGSDVTLLFQFKQPALFHAQMDGFLESTAKEVPGSTRTEGEYHGVKFAHVTSPDRIVHVFSAYPTPGLHVRSNSRIAFERVLDTILHKKETHSLGDTDEYAYIRTLIPYRDTKEDGFVYLSDPFIRQIVGPQLKLTERRRRLCYNHLRMIGHGAAMYETEFGHAPKSIAALTAAGCASAINTRNANDDDATDEDNKPLTCSCGGKYTLSADGRTARCSHHGRAEAMIPCCEIPLESVPYNEAARYKTFVKEYNQYWRTFFDPIAIRIQQTPERYRVETIILPLLDNSIYSTMATVLGGEPKSLDAQPVPQRNIFSLAFQIDKKELLEANGWEQPPVIKKPLGSDIERQIHSSADNLKQIAFAMHKHHSKSKSGLPAFASFSKQGQPLLSWRVHILPEIGYVNLYKKFHLDEPWDSEHNHKLLAKMPSVYRTAGRKNRQLGTTRYVVPVGPKTAFSGKEKGVEFSAFEDGTSHTLMVFEASKEYAVPWTKPQDIGDQASEIRKALFGTYPELGIAAFADGSIRRITNEIEDKELQAALTRNGGETTGYLGVPENNRSRRSIFIGDLFGSKKGSLDERLVYDFVTVGLSDVLSFHIYDSEPTFDFQLPRFFSMMTGGFSGSRNSFGEELLPIAFVISSLNAPVYLSMPLEDTGVVDRFLEQLDQQIAVLSQKQHRDWFFEIEHDFYTYPLTNNITARSAGVQYGPIKWRFFWARIGKTLVIASKPEVLDDLVALENIKSPQAKPSVDNPDTQAHAMVRIRPENWQQVLASYRLGWAERYRMACHDNIGPLTSAYRLAAANSSTKKDASELAQSIYGVRHYCPCGGEYSFDSENQTATCSLHGNAAAPFQHTPGKTSAPAENVLNTFGGLTVGLTFLEDGLHAVLNIERKLPQKNE